MMTIFQPFANTLWNSLKDTEITKVPKTDLRDTGDSPVQRRMQGKRCHSRAGFNRFFSGGCYHKRWHGRRDG